MKTNEAALSDSIKLGKLSRLYYLCGKEPFLSKIYADRIIKKAVGDEPMDFNLLRFDGNPDLDVLSDAVEGLPCFAERKAVVINDLDPEKLDADSNKRLCEMFSDIPDTTVLVVYITGFVADVKKAKTKKLLSVAEKYEYGCVCEFEPLSAAKIQTMIGKRAARSGCVITKENAAYLAELTLMNMNLIGSELDKLCAYTGKGEISRETIDSLVTKQLDAGIYMLATAISSGNRNDTFRIFDELVDQRIEPVTIMSALSGTFVDFYRIKLGKNEGKSQAQIVADFNYPPNRAWVVGKAMGTVSATDAKYLRKCINTLARADIMLKSSSVDSKTIMEQAIIEIFGK